MMASISLSDAFPDAKPLLAAASSSEFAESFPVFRKSPMAAASLPVLLPRRQNR